MTPEIEITYEEAIKRLAKAANTTEYNVARAVRGGFIRLPYERGFDRKSRWVLVEDLERAMKDKDKLAML